MGKDIFYTMVSAPGWTTNSLWFLASNQRQQSVVNDPNLGWVGRTVPILKELEF